MPIYKVTIEAIRKGIFSDTRITGVELYAAKNALEAKKIAEENIQKEKENSLLLSDVAFIIKDVEKME